MRYCSNCGAQNENDAKFCSSCGTQLEAASAAETKEAAEVTETPVEAAAETPAQEPAPAPIPTPAPAPAQPYQPYQSQVQTEAITPKGRTFGIIGFILGIVSTAFCWVGVLPVGGLVAGFFMVACGVVGLIFCNISKKEGFFKLANIGKVFAIIGICLSGVCWIIGIFVSAAYITTIQHYGNDYGTYNIGGFNDINDINDINDLYNYFN